MANAALYFDGDKWIYKDGLSLATKTAQDKRSAIRIRSTDYKGELLTGVFCFKDTAYIRKGSTGNLDLHGIAVPALSIVKVSHWDDQSGSEGSCGWWGYLKRN